MSQAGAGDIFLWVKGAKSGEIKGESQDTVHAKQIDVVSWSWGMQAKPALGGGGATGKAIVHELKIVKRVDSASTPLMSALRSNEMISKAVLTQRKAGKTQLDDVAMAARQFKDVDAPILGVILNDMDISDRRYGGYYYYAYGNYGETAKSEAA